MITDNVVGIISLCAKPSGKQVIGRICLPRELSMLFSLAPSQYFAIPLNSANLTTFLCISNKYIEVTTCYKPFCWFCREFRERRKQNAVKNELNQLNQRVKKTRRTRTTQHTFYPCPPPTASELDNYDDDDSDDEFIDYNAVRSACLSYLSFDISSFACYSVCSLNVISNTCSEIRALFPPLFARTIPILIVFELLPLKYHNNFYFNDPLTN